MRFSFPLPRTKNCWLRRKTRTKNFSFHLLKTRRIRIYGIWFNIYSIKCIYRGGLNARWDFKFKRQLCESLTSRENTRKVSLRGNLFSLPLSLFSSCVKIYKWRRFPVCSFVMVTFPNLQLVSVCSYSCKAEEHEHSTILLLFTHTTVHANDNGCMYSSGKTSFDLEICLADERY